MNPSQLIDEKIADHPDWRGRTLAEVRRVIRQTVPDVIEEWKWMGTPTWSKNGILCICNPFKDMVKVTFNDGARLHLDALFNAELGGNKWRAIKYFEGDKVNAAGLKKLLLAAAAFNAAMGKGKAKSAPIKASSTTKTAKVAKAAKAPRRASAAKARAKP